MQTLDKTGACRHALTRGENANGVLPRRRLAALIACALVLSSCAALDSSPRPLGPFSGRPDAEAGASFKSAAILDHDINRLGSVYDHSRIHFFMPAWFALRTFYPF